MFSDLFQPDVIRHIITAGTILLISAVAGYIFNRIILTALKRAAARTKWEGDDILIHSLRGVSVFWFIIGGAYIALHTIAMPPQYLGVGKKILVVILIFSVTVIAARVVAGLLDLYVRKNEAATQSVSILTLVGRMTIYVVGALIILQFLGISITPILTALGVGGLAVALALQGILSNLFSGMQIIASRKVKIGDYIRMDSGEEGNVVDINWHNTTVRALSNNLIMVPNSKLANAIVTDYHEPDREMTFTVSVSVSYRSDLTHVETVTTDVARDILKSIEGGVSDFEPLVRFHTFGESAIQFNVILRAKEFDQQFRLRHEFIKRLHTRYAQEGIEIPFPIRTIEMRPNPQKSDTSS